MQQRREATINMITSRFQIDRWDQVAGNEPLVKRLQSMVRSIRLKRKPCSQRLLIQGASRTGKTALSRLFLRCLACKGLNANTLNPCNECSSCKSTVERHGAHTLNAIDLTECSGNFLQVRVMSGSKIESIDYLRQVLSEMSWNHADLQVCYLDEVHMLSTAMQELLYSIEDSTALWVCSTAEPTKLQQMLINRFTVCKTSLPSESQMIAWLIGWCNYLGISYEDDAVHWVATRSNFNCGIALAALEEAALCGGLTVAVAQEWTPATDLLGR